MGAAFHAGNKHCSNPLISMLLETSRQTRFSCSLAYTLSNPVNVAECFLEHLELPSDVDLEAELLVLEHVLKSFLHAFEIEGC